MENSNTQNNIIELSGQIASEFTYSHQVYGEAFYSFMLCSKRLSDTYDTLPVTVSERLLIDVEAKSGYRSAPLLQQLFGRQNTFNTYGFCKGY